MTDNRRGFDSPQLHSLVRCICPAQGICTPSSAVFDLRTFENDQVDHPVLSRFIVDMLAPVGVFQFRDWLR